MGVGPATKDVRRPRRAQIPPKFDLKVQQPSSTNPTPKTLPRPQWKCLPPEHQAQTNPFIRKLLAEVLQTLSVAARLLWAFLAISSYFSNCGSLMLALFHFGGVLGVDGSQLHSGTFGFDWVLVLSNPCS